MAERAEAVVFDIGNVLIEWDPAKVYGPLLPDPEAFFARTGLHEMNLAVDRGRPMGEAVAERATAHPADADLIALWESRWAEMARPAIPGSVALLEALRGRGVPVYALSNFGAETFEVARGMYPFLDLFDGRVISAHHRTIKPEARIYEILEEMAGRRGGGLFFTDDRADNIAAAAARGWQTHLFDGPEGLAAALRNAGLL
ncbi:MAG: HAD-IA family hydrolase [Pseudomonadota bacterium]